MRLAPPAWIALAALVVVACSRSSLPIWDLDDEANGTTGGRKSTGGYAGRAGVGGGLPTTGGAYGFTGGRAGSGGRIATGGTPWYTGGRPGTGGRYVTGGTPPVYTGGRPGTGGRYVTGGTPPVYTGGRPGTGGVIGIGGVPIVTGGRPGTGGVIGIGGVPIVTGGRTATGGVIGIGGLPIVTGGRTATGGVIGIGGVIERGGSVGIGGTAGTGGSDGGLYECDPVRQTCRPGLRCDLPDTGEFVFRCLPDLGGQGQQNEICTDSSADCAKGSTCLQDTDRFGNPIGPARCTFFCYLNTDCPTGNYCLDTGIIGPTGNITFGICLPIL